MLPAGLYLYIFKIDDTDRQLTVRGQLRNGHELRCIPLGGLSVSISSPVCEKLK